MKKYFLTAILSLLVVTVFTSCGDNDIIEETEKPSSELKVWVEPYHIKGASLDEVTTYMSGTMMRYHFEAENKTADSFQLAYKTGNDNEAILYSFLRSDSTLYSVIDTELISNSRLIIDYLKKHYTLVSASDETSYQYCFTTEDRSMVITTMKVSESCFNVVYSFVSERIKKFEFSSAIRNSLWRTFHCFESMYIYMGNSKLKLTCHKLSPMSAH